MNKTTAAVVIGALGIIGGGLYYLVSKKSKDTQVKSDVDKPVSDNLTDIKSDVTFDMSTATIIIPPTDIEQLTIKQSVEEKISNINAKLEEALKDDSVSISIVEIEKALDDSDNGSVCTPNGIRITRYGKRKGRKHDNS